MITNTLIFQSVEQFRCTQGKCEDTCCFGWDMQLGTRTVGTYKELAPELLESITVTPEGPIMKRKEGCDNCVQLSKGLCGIHKNYGETMLGDACYFYPRITRSYGQTALISAALSCPEITKNMLFGESPFVLTPVTQHRFPQEMKDYLPSEVSTENAINIITALLDFINDPTHDLQTILGTLLTITGSLDHIAPTRWAAGLPFLLRTACERMPQPQMDRMDPFKLIHSLSYMLANTKHRKSDRILKVFETTADQCGVSIHWEELGITMSEDALQRYQTITQSWHKKSKKMDRILRRYLQAEITVLGLPFTQPGETVRDRCRLLFLRFAMIRLCLMSYPGNLTKTAIVTIIQSLSRIIDHLGNHQFILAMMDDAGWKSDARLLGLVTLAPHNASKDRFVDVKVKEYVHAL